jgi:hypothetical protein
MGRVTGQLAGTAWWAGAGRLVLDMGADGAPALQLAVMIAAAIATSWAARFMQIIVGHGGAVWKWTGPRGSPRPPATEAAILPLLARWCFSRSTASR